MYSRTILLALIAVSFFSCGKKDDEKDVVSTYDCPFNQDTTIQSIENLSATVISSTSSPIIKFGNPDTTLNACNLPVGFIIDNLRVMISGDLKLTPSGINDTCRCFNFVIRRIERTK